MKIYDISQEVFSCAVFPGDPAPEKQTILSTQNGDICNLTALSMCAHNGTHIDAPFHFLADGKTVDQIPLHKTVGYCFVTDFAGTLTAQIAEQILNQARQTQSGAELRILFQQYFIGSQQVADLLLELLYPLPEHGILLL